MHALERGVAERGGGLGNQMRRDAVRRRTGVALPDAERRRIGLRRRTQPRARIGAELLQRAVRVGLEPQEEAPPVQLYPISELLLNPAQAHGREVAPGSEVVGIDDEMDWLHGF